MSSLRRAAALLAPLVVLTFTLAASPSQAEDRAPASGVAWHKLAAMNGWHTSSATTGRPAYAVSRSVVYLSGAVTSAGTNPLFAVLPSAAAPAHTLYMTVYTHGGVPGTIRIDPDGDMTAVGGPSGFRFTSLAGVSFPAQSMTMTAMRLRNGWVSGQSDFDTGNPSYSVNDSVVYMSGSVHQPAGTVNEFFHFPAGLHPPSYLDRLDFTMSPRHGVVEENKYGALLALGRQAKNFTSLAGLSYPLHKGKRLNLVNGWYSSIVGSPATYQVSHGVVYLTGGISQHPAAGARFAVLPPGARPAHVLYLTVFVNGFIGGTVKISPSGAMSAMSKSATHARIFTSLLGVSFPLGS